MDTTNRRTGRTYRMLGKLVPLLVDRKQIIVLCSNSFMVGYIMEMFIEKHAMKSLIQKIVGGQNRVQFIEGESVTFKNINNVDESTFIGFGGVVAIDHSCFDYPTERVAKVLAFVFHQERTKCIQVISGL